MKMIKMPKIIQYVLVVLFLGASIATTIILGPSLEEGQLSGTVETSESDEISILWKKQDSEYGGIEVFKTDELPVSLKEKFALLHRGDTVVVHYHLQHQQKRADQLLLCK